jgi:hypothetical protein
MPPEFSLANWVPRRRDRRGAAPVGEQLFRSRKGLRATKSDLQELFAQLTTNCAGFWLVFNAGWGEPFPAKIF